MNPWSAAVKTALLVGAVGRSASQSRTVTLHFSICWGSAAPLPLLELHSCSYKAVTLLALGWTGVVLPHSHVALTGLLC